MMVTAAVMMAMGSGDMSASGNPARPAGRAAGMAEWTGLEPATPGVTGRYSNQLNYHSEEIRYSNRSWWVLRGSNPRPSPCKGDALPTELSTRERPRVKASSNDPQGGARGSPRPPPISAAYIASARNDCQQRVPGVSGASGQSHSRLPGVEWRFPSPSRADFAFEGRRGGQDWGSPAGSSVADPAGLAARKTTFHVRKRLPCRST